MSIEYNDSSATGQNNSFTLQTVGQPAAFKYGDVVYITPDDPKRQDNKDWHRSIISHVPNMLNAETAKHPHCILGHYYCPVMAKLVYVVCLQSQFNAGLQKTPVTFHVIKYVIEDRIIFYKDAIPVRYPAEELRNIYNYFQTTGYK